MKNIKLLTVFVLVLTILTSCSKKQGSGIMENDNDCNFVQDDDNMDALIDDTEMMLMKECRNNSLTSKSDIEFNLIGEWELTGFGGGWIPTISKPCGLITISEDELIFEFKNEHINKRSTHQWEIEKVTLNGREYFRLNVPSGYVEGLFINQFCENYMYGDSSPGDGFLYLYTKVK